MKGEEEMGRCIVLRNIGHCSTDMHSLGLKESSRMANVLLSLVKGKMDEAESC